MGERFDDYCNDLSARLEAMRPWARGLWVILLMCSLGAIWGMISIMTVGVFLQSLLFLGLFLLLIPWKRWWHFWLGVVSLGAAWIAASEERIAATMTVVAVAILIAQLGPGFFPGDRSDRKA